MSAPYEDTRLCLLTVHEASHAVVARALGFWAEPRVWRNPQPEPAHARWLGVCLSEGTLPVRCIGRTEALELLGGSTTGALHPLMLFGLAGLVGELIAAGTPSREVFPVLDAKRGQACWSDSDRDLSDGFDRAHVERAEWLLRRHWPLVIDEARALYQYASMNDHNQAALHAACRAAAAAARLAAGQGAQP